MTAVLEIRLFGGLEIRQGDAPMGGFISSKSPALLAYLAITRRAHQRDALAGLLWGEMADADAKNNLRQSLTNLRKLLEPHLLISRDTVQFNWAAAGRLDVAEFEAHLQAGRDGTAASRAHAFQQAAALYEGDFLAGFYVRDAPEFEEWMLAQRARYRELALHILHTLTDHHLERGEYGRAIEWATALLALDGWREEAHRQLMVALARSGQRSAALAQYESCRRLLSRELGVAPSAETTALYERIRAAGDIPPHNLPPQPTPFVGRLDELAQIEGMLQEPACRLVTVTGTGGMGKTRLGLQAAAQAHRRGLFLHGVFFVPLVGVDSVTLLATAVATACGLQFSGSQEPSAQLLTFLRQREVLLVLDNFEHLLEESAWLIELLQQATGVKLLVTSRESLNIQWERSLSLEGLTVPPPAASTTDIAAYSAVQLFTSRAQAAWPDFALTAETIPCLTRICHLVAGMPLALELAAATIRHYTCVEIAEAITSNLDILATTYRDMPLRHRSLRAVFDNAWALLPPPERGLFTALTVFVGSFSQEAAEKIAGATRPLLAALVDKSLLRQGGDGRYQLHNVLRQYAAEKLSEPEGQSLGQRHAAFYAEWLHHQEKELFTPAEATFFQGIQNDLENIRTAWFWSLENGQLSLLEQSLRGLRSFYNVRSRFLEGAEWMERTAVGLRPLVRPLLTADNRAALALYGRVLARWASFAAWQGHNDQAEALFTEVVPIARQINDTAELGFLLLNKGYFTTLSGDYERAGREYEESLAYYRRSEDAHGIADALSALGGWHNVTGDWSAARQCLEESVAIARQINDENGLRSSLTNLGNVHYLLGDYGQAKVYYEAVLPLCQKVNDRASEAVIRCNLGALAEKAGDFTAAEQQLQRGIALFEESNHLQAVVHGATMLVAVYRQMGQLARAQKLLSQALEQAIQKKYDYLIPIAIFEIGVTWVAMERKAEGLPLLLWVMAHPAAQAENRLEAEKVVGKVEAELSSKQVAEAKLAGVALQATAVLERLEREEGGGVV